MCSGSHPLPWVRMGMFSSSSQMTTEDLKELRITMCRTLGLCLRESQV